MVGERVESLDCRMFAEGQTEIGCSLVVYRSPVRILQDREPGEPLRRGFSRSSHRVA